jgi:SecD/SecF fusion protein
MPRATFSQIVNRSMSEVLTRSLATSFSALLPITALMLFGGETLRDFGFALLVGTISGAYSSIFIASPVLSLWKEREPVYRRRRRLALADHGGKVPAFADVSLGTAERGDGAGSTPEESPLPDAGRRGTRGAQPGARQRLGRAARESPPTEDGAASSNRPAGPPSAAGSNGESTPGPGGRDGKGSTEARRGRSGAGAKRKRRRHGRR